jgi:dihydroorotase
MVSERNPIIIRKAHLFDPSMGIDIIGDVYIEDGHIFKIGQDIYIGDDHVEVIEADGKYLFPAFCDPHVHFRTPGQTEKEDLQSGSRAALAGGFTTVIQMPNTIPAVDTPEIAKDLTRDEPIELRVMGAITVGTKSRELVEMEPLLEAGVVGFTDDGEPVFEAVFMKAALDFGAQHGVPVASHAENPTIGLRGIIREGIISDTMDVPGWNAQRETTMIERDCELANRLGAQLHIYHVSVKQSVEVIRQAKADGVNVTAETTPHHIALTVEIVPDLLANAKMNPPLGTDEDRWALIEGFRDGTIDCIATDHAPHTPEEKLRDLHKAPFGVIGLETSFGVCYTELIKKGNLPLSRLIEGMTSRPREIFKLEKIGLFEGSRADLTLVDLDMEWVVDPDKFESKAENCPFVYRSLFGKVLWTMYRGDIAWKLV